jgi:hypothetical protein
MAAGAEERTIGVTFSRLPDLVIIGTMKSATSSLYWWLSEQPECFLASPKEIDFFSDDSRWRRGPGWYGRLFDDAQEGQLLGEASVSYTSPDRSTVSAERMASLLPAARLLCVIRNPVDRLRSHFRHEVQRNRERRPFMEALRAPSNPYLAASRYFACLRPYLERFPPEQLCVIRFEDLVGGEQPGWADVLRSLGLPFRGSPGTAHNVTGDNRQWTPAMQRLHRMGVLRFSHVVRLPQPVRRLGGRVLMRDRAAYQHRLEDSHAPIPDEVTEPIWEDLSMLERGLGSAAPLWPRPTSDAVRSRP